MSKPGSITSSVQKPRRPQAGQLAAIVAPSASGRHLSAAAYQRASRRLHDLGLRVRPGRYLADGDNDLVAAEKRAEDFMAAVNDQEVGLIMAVYGGYNAIDVLPLLDYEAIARERKVLMGFSDITTLLAALLTRARLSSFHGPNFATLGEPALHDFTWQGIRRALGPGGNTLRDPGVSAEDAWFRNAPGERRAWSHCRWTAFRQGRSSGPLVGGNLPSLISLAGTPYFPDCRDAIILVEVNIGSNPAEVDRGMAQLALMGVFDHAAGIVVGAGDKEMELRLPRILEKSVLPKVRGPVLTGVQCSHVDPLMTLPYGAAVTLHADDMEISYHSALDD